MTITSNFSDSFSLDSISCQIIRQEILLAQERLHS
jgi:hypothetical protein